MSQTSDEPASASRRGERRFGGQNRLIEVVWQGKSEPAISGFDRMLQKGAALAGVEGRSLKNTKRAPKARFQLRPNP